MTRFFAILFLLSLSISSYAQDDKIYYFDDSNVKKSIFGIEAGVNPGVSSSNLIQAAEVDLGEDIYYTSGVGKSLFSFGYGARLIISPSKSLDFRVGVNMANYGFRQRDIFLFSSTDTALVDITTKVKSVSVPIIMAFKNELGTDWQLEYGVGWELGFIQDYKNTYEIKENTAGADIPPFSQHETSIDGIKHSLVIQLGGAYVLNPKTTFFVLPNFRYMFTPLITDGSQGEVAPYVISLDMGIRYRF